MYKPLLLLCMQCIQVLFVYSDASERATRGLSMLRMGKRNLGFLRMGRSFELPPLVPPSYDLPEDDIEERNIIGSPRMGKHLDDYDIPRYESARAPPYPRLGVYDEYVNEIRRALSSPDDEIRQIYASIPRAGRYLGRQKRSVDDIQPVESETEEQVDGTPEHKEKRALPRFGLRETGEIPFPRLGLVDRDIPFPRLGLYERAAFPRLGVREEDDEARSILMPRLGLRESENEIQAEERALPRFGLRNTDEEKRAMSMLRMGKREDETTEEKRAMSMLRMGKRGMSMLRMGKRGVSMLRMGRSQPTDAKTEEQKRAVSMLRMGRSLENEDATATNTDEQEKRAMSMLRMGKRGHMSMLRMGRSYEDEANNKRAVSMLRMGRGMGMLRMGKSIPEQQQQEAEQKRAMSMLRMGRGMSMLRMGKRSVDEGEEANNAEGKRNMSALRMGKKNNEEES